MARKVRLDFIEHPSGAGFVVALNGRPIGDRFADPSEVAVFAADLGIAPNYAGTGRSEEGTTPSESGGSGEHG